MALTQVVAKRLSSLSHPFVKDLVRLRTERSERYRQRRVFVEGWQQIVEICQHNQNMRPRTLLVANSHPLLTGVHNNMDDDDKSSQQRRLPPNRREPLPAASFTPRRTWNAGLGNHAIRTLLENTEVIDCTDNVMSKLSGTEQGQGVVAEFDMPPIDVDLTRVKTETRSPPHILVLDGIADPGNLGTALRTALAFGWHGAWIMNGSCDPFNDKAIRASAGATFKLPLHLGSWSQLQTAFKLQSSSSPSPSSSGSVSGGRTECLLADAHGQPIDTYLSARRVASSSSPSSLSNDALLLVLSNERHGPSADARALMSHTVAVPLQPGMPSLNVAVAAGILLHQLRPI
jgi:TrmH family RNA methyltransferase